MQQLFFDAKASTANARVLALGYARFFPSFGGGSVPFVGPPKCEGLTLADQLWINDWIMTLDNAIKFAAHSTGNEYVDLVDASAAHELCATNGASPYMHGLRGIPFARDGERKESFHPTPFGQVRIAERVNDVLNQPPPPAATIQQGQTVTRTLQVTPGTPSAIWTTSWPGSDVVLSLRSPSGRTIDRTTVASDISHQVGPRNEIYVVRNPEPGEWTATLFGAEVSPGGESVTFTATNEEPPNARPHAVVAVSQQGWHVEVSAAGSGDPNGHIVDYAWDFGDGTVAAGSQASHTYRSAGRYRPALVVTDDGGALGFSQASVDIVANSDPTPPTISITSPVDGATFTLGQAVSASFTCLDAANGSGLASCSGTASSGTPLDTATVGTRTLAVTATDNAGNTTTITRTYRVVYPFTGFMQPVDNPPVVNTTNAGRAIPVKFSLGGNRGLGIMAAGSPASAVVNCSTGAQLAELEQTSSAGNSSLSYDSVTATYTYVWKTDKAWAQTCRRLDVRLIDGTVQTAIFKFR